MSVRDARDVDLRYDRRMHRLVMIVLLVVACAKKQDEPKPPPPTPASGSAPAAPPDGAAPAAKPELLPAKLGDKEGVVFAEKQGEKVTATVKGQSVMIPDGTKVEIVGENEIGVGSPEQAHLTVKFEHHKVELTADRVLREASLERSTDGKHAVFMAITACGDLCHSVIYLLSADGRRTKLGDGGPDVTVAWTADKVAVGSGGLWIATLADHAVKSLEDYTSPAVSPDGVLYVRDHEGSAFKLDGDKPTQVWKAKKKPAAGEGDLVAEDPAPVTFEGGKPKFDL